VGNDWPNLQLDCNWRKYSNLAMVGINLSPGRRPKSHNFASIDGMGSVYGLRIETQPTSISGPLVPKLLLTPDGGDGKDDRPGRFSVRQTIRRLCGRPPSKVREGCSTTETVVEEGTNPPHSLSLNPPTPFRSVISDATIVEQIVTLATGFDRKISSYKQCKWAVSDKEKCGNLIDQLGKYNEGLVKIPKPLYVSTCVYTPLLSQRQLIPGVKWTSMSHGSFDEFHIQTELPFPRIRYICCREDLIDRIHEIFHPEKAAGAFLPLLWGLYGLDGIGKTQVLEYAHRHEGF